MEKETNKGLNGIVRNKYFPYILIFITTIIQLFILLKYFNYPLTSDDLGYNEMALQLLNNEKFAPYWPPGLPLLISLFYKIFGAHTGIARLAVFVLYPVFFTYLYLFAVKLSNRKVGLLAIVFFAIYPAFRLYAVVPLTEMLAATFLLIALYYLVGYMESGKYVQLALVGIFTGFLILTRPSSGLLVVVIFGFIFFVKRKLLAAAVPVLIALVIVFGWVGHCYNMTGKLVPINYANSFNVFLGNNEHAPLYKMWPPVPDKYFDDLQDLKDQISNDYSIEDRDAVYKEMAIEHIKDRPDLFLLRTFNRVKVFFSFDSQTASFFKANYGVSSLTTVIILGASFVLYMLSMLFFLIALFNFRRLNLKYFSLICSVVLLYALPYFVSFSFNRFNVPILPLIVIVALICFDRVFNRETKMEIRPLFKLKSKTSLLFMFTLLFLVYIQVEYVFFMFSRF